MPTQAIQFPASQTPGQTAVPTDPQTARTGANTPAPVGIPAASNFAVHDSQGDLENRQRKFGMMMKPFSL